MAVSRIWVAEIVFGILESQCCLDRISAADYTIKLQGYT